MPRASCHRPAPNVIRTPISDDRDAERAKASIATLPHASNRINPISPRSTSNGSRHCAPSPRVTPLDAPVISKAIAMKDWRRATVL